VGTQIRQHPSRRVAGVVAAGLLMCTFMFLFSGTASAAATCKVGNTKNADGSIDLTGYLACQFPAVTPNPAAPGSAVTINAGGFAPGSDVTITLACPGVDPVVLGVVPADSLGNVKVSETIPANTPLGACTITESGVDPNEQPLSVVEAVTISSTSGDLPRTGSDIGQYVGLGVALIALGGAAVWGSRRDRTKQAA